MANDQALNGQPESDQNRNSRADLENNVGTPDQVTQEGQDQTASQHENKQRGTTPHADKAA